MATLREKVEDFLGQKRIAVAGVSRTKNDAANMIYRKLRKTGYEVFAINPNAETAEGDTCYPDLKSLPEKADGVVIVTRPEVTGEIVQQCAELGIPRIWMHRSFRFLGGSVSDEAVRLCNEKGITVIAGGCPMMFCEPVDFAHKCMRGLLRLTGGLPEQEGTMFCPQCGAEFREGISECPDCMISLVRELPPEGKPEWTALVTVFEPVNESELVLAKSLLEGAGIRYLVKGERTQDLLGIGRVGTGYNVLMGPAEIQVGKEREQEARELLAHLEEDLSDDEST